MIYGVLNYLLLHLFILLFSMFVLFSLNISFYNETELEALKEPVSLDLCAY